MTLVVNNVTRLGIKSYKKDKREMTTIRRQRIFLSRAIILLLVCLIICLVCPPCFAPVRTVTASWAGWDGIDTIAIIPSSDGFLDTAAQELKTYLEEISRRSWTIIQSDVGGPATDGQLTDYEDVTITVVQLYEDWDINGDGVADVLDMVLVGQHWGEAGLTGWIREDANEDGTVNVLDMIIIGQHWTG
jgi:hypothetical protein